MSGWNSYPTHSTRRTESCFYSTVLSSLRTLEVYARKDVHPDNLQTAENGLRRSAAMAAGVGRDQKCCHCAEIDRGMLPCPPSPLPQNSQLQHSHRKSKK